MRSGFATAVHPASRLDDPRPSGLVRKVQANDAALLAEIHEASGRGDVIETLRLASALRDNHARIAALHDPAVIQAA